MPSLQETLHGLAIANIQSHAVDHDALRIEGPQERLRIGIGENIRGALEDQDLSPPFEDFPKLFLLQRLMPQDHWILQASFLDTLRSGSSSHAMGRIGEGEIRGIADLSVLVKMVVSGSHDRKASSSSGLGQPSEIGQKSLCLRHVEPAVRRHEVDLGIDIPEKQRSG